MKVKNVKDSSSYQSLVGGVLVEMSWRRKPPAEQWESYEVNEGNYAL